MTGKRPIRNLWTGRFQITDVTRSGLHRGGFPLDRVYRVDRGEAS